MQYFCLPGCLLQEMGVPPIARIAWSAEGDYDLRGVRGVPDTTARRVGGGRRRVL